MRGLHEIVPIPDTFCSALGAIERLEGNIFRFWLYVLQTPEDGQVQEKIVVAKIVMSAASVPDAVLQTIGAITECDISIAPAVADLVH